MDVRFLWWLLRSRVFREILDTNLPGGIKTELKAKRLLPIKVPLPTLNEQRRIVTLIDNLSSKIDEARNFKKKAIAEVDAIVNAEILCIFESEVRLKGWQPKPLGEAGEIARGKFTHRPRNAPEFYGGKIPFIQIGDISSSDRYIQEFSQTLNDRGLTISRLFPKGTVVIAITGATVGATGILDFDSCFPDSIVGIILRANVAVSEYIYWALESVKALALSEATQTTQPNINLKNLVKLRIPVPPVPEQESLVSRIDHIRAKVNTLKKLQSGTSAELDALMPSILAKAFRGEL